MREQADVVIVGTGIVGCSAAYHLAQRGCTDVVVLDRGSYLRVLVPGRCRMTREAVERALGRPFRLPGDLERVMPSFKGRLVVGDDEVVWSFDRA